MPFVYEVVIAVKILSKLEGGCLIYHLSTTPRKMFHTEPQKLRFMKGKSRKTRHGLGTPFFQGILSCESIQFKWCETNKNRKIEPGFEIDLGVFQ